MKIEQEDALFFVLNVINSCTSQSHLTVAYRLAELYYKQSGDKCKKVVEYHLKLQSNLG
jgi:hypothetical protein